MREPEFKVGDIVWPSTHRRESKRHEMLMYNPGSREYNMRRRWYENLCAERYRVVALHAPNTEHNYGMGWVYELQQFAPEGPHGIRYTVDYLIELLPTEGA